MKRSVFLSRRFVISVLALVMIAGALSVGAVRGAQPAEAAPVPGFSDKAVLSGLKHPTNLEFAPDGTIFITEKSGKIWSYTSFTDPSPKLVIDLGPEVDDYWDRGLLGLAVAPTYPADNHLYVLYARDAPLGGTAPTWNDACPSPPGPTTDGCMVSGRLARLTIENGVATQVEPLLDGWCQQFPSHSIGTIMFGPDGYLYASGGEGASFTAVDYGQFGAAKPGNAANVCGDPPGGVGTALTPPAAEGGSLRAQSALRTNGPAVLNGSVIRIDPATGAAAPGNPFSGSSDPDKARISAFGFRNPFRMTTRPGTREIWVGDVGQGRSEEIDRIVDPTAAATNFGWPCYEGAGINTGFQSVGLTQCTNLYQSPGSTVAPFYTYDHAGTVTTADGCPTGGSSITGLAFYEGTSYPAPFRKALYFTDHTRQCLWAMVPDASGTPDPANIISLGHVADPVELVQGPAAYDNDLFYVALDGGAIHQLSYTPGNAPPTAVAKVTPASGQAPLTVSFTGSGSTDPEKGALKFAWNFGDGTTSTAVSGTHVYVKAGTYTPTLTVTDPLGLTSSATATVLAGSAKVTVLNVAVTSPTGLRRAKYRVGDRLNFSATAVDAANRPIPASNFSWHLSIHHCETVTNCHAHDGGSLNGVSKGAFTAPDHPYPYYLTIELTVTLPGTSNTLAMTSKFQPETVAVTLKTNQTAKIPLTLDGVSKAAPYTVTMVRGHLSTISAPKTVYLAGHKYTFTSWSDKGAATHTIVGPIDPTTRTANYKKVY